MKDTKNIIIIVLSIIVLILSWVVFDSKTTPLDSELEKHELERLNKENKDLLKRIDSRDSLLIKKTLKIDSLESLKPKIKKIYVEKYKQIDSASSGVIINEFDSIFTKNNIK